MNRSASYQRPGSALVLALWIALLLGVAGMAATRLAAIGAGAAQVEADLARARAVAEGGIWAAAHRLAAQPREARPPRAEFRFPLGSTQVVVRAVDEDGRLDLNAAPEALLAALFGAAGLEATPAAALAARVVAWRERDNQGGGGVVREGGPFRSPGELGAVPGLSAALAAALRNSVTVHTGRPEPAAEAAPPLVLAILRQAAEAAPLPRRGLRTPQPQGGGGAGRRSIWRIEAEARSGAVVARVAAVLALAPTEGLPGRVLEWRPAGS